MSASFVVMAAGLGSRYGGIKQMDGVGPNQEILLEYALYDAIRAGYDRLVVILRPDIVDAFQERVGKKYKGKLPLYYAIQDYSTLPAFYPIPQNRIKPFGTIHAVLCAAPYIDGPFTVLNADDYYGRNAFRELRSTLSTLRCAQEGCMVAYPIQNTISPYGSVTRGICTVEKGALCDIAETRGITLQGDGRIVSDGKEIPGDTPVSMNLWGFHQESLADMEVYFHQFLRSLSPDDVEAECLLPVYVGDRLHQGKLGIKVLSTDGSWFGMTYKEDREVTKRSLRALIDEGYYPVNLTSL